MENILNNLEKPEYLTDQLITYIGNKRALLDFISQGVDFIKADSKKDKLHCFDVFSGSGIVSRFLKSHALSITANDMENYSQIINRCYLQNESELPLETLKKLHQQLCSSVEQKLSQLSEKRNKQDFVNPGFISQLYAPQNEENIQKGERCFYTPENANYLDLMRQEIEKSIPEEYRDFFIAPLLSQASVHANTAGIFKGFYKNSKTGIGQFGGTKSNALSRIRGKIQLPFPVFSNFSCPFHTFQSEANALVKEDELYSHLPDHIFDLAYIDPPYNQHPYGSNYFMLNLLASYQAPDASISRVSGIPKNWNRSLYNKKKKVSLSFTELVTDIRARYLMISFNSESFITKEELVSILEQIGQVTVLEKQYNTFRGSRNLKNRSIYVKEYIFIVKKYQYN